jgi:ABC-2 type transport system permease protein
VADLRWRAVLYLRLIGARVRSQLQYRLSFTLDLLGAFFISFIDFLAVIFLFSHLPRLAGWTLPEVAFFYGTANMAFALSDMIVGHLDTFGQMIKTGSFDLMLVRPVGSLYQVLSSDLQMRRVGRIAQGLVVLIYAVSRLSISWSAATIGMVALMVVTGTVIYSSIWIAGASIAFFTVEIRELNNAFTYGGSFLASYPVNIFGGWTRRLMAFVIPLAFVSYFPGLFVLGHPDPLGTPEALRYCAPLVAIALAVIAGRAWRFGVRHYRSTGS